MINYNNIPSTKYWKSNKKVVSNIHLKTSSGISLLNSI